MQDSELISQYVKQGSDKAFAQLVDRYADLVYSTAQRQLSDPHMAEDVAQSVFCLLARKASSFTGQLTLAGWLYRATCFTAAKVTRTEQRRRRREQEAAEMDSPYLSAEAAWEHLSPLLDRGLEQLSEKDRLAVLLRFFQHKSLREVGETIGSSEDAAKMRVKRAIEQLRQFFSKNKITCSAAVLANLLSQKSLEATPAHLTTKCTAAALSGTAAFIPLSIWETLMLINRLKTKALTTLGAVVLITLIPTIHLYNASRPVSVPIATVQPSDANTVAADQQQLPMRRHSTTSIAPPPADAPDWTDAIAALRKALHEKQSAASNPRVALAIKRFGAHREIAFAVLKEEATINGLDPKDSDTEECIPKRALSGMQHLDRLPEAMAFLWETYEASSIQNPGTLGYLAFEVLSEIGFEPEELPRLIDRGLRNPKYEDMEIASKDKIQAFMNSRIADCIARVYNRSIEPNRASLENALDDQNPMVRFWVACGLLQHEASTNPRIFVVINESLKQIDDFNLQWASFLFFRQSTTSLKPIASALLDAAKNANDYRAREYSFVALGNIDPALRDQIPEVDQASERSERIIGLLRKINAKTATFDDLVSGLGDNRASLAASALGDMGPAASNAVPAMIAALQRDEDSTGNHQQILEAVAKIDPQAALQLTGSKRR